MPERAINYMFDINTPFDHMLWNHITDIISSMGVEARYIYSITNDPPMDSPDYEEIFSGPILQESRYVRIFVCNPDVWNVLVIVYELFDEPPPED